MSFAALRYRVRVSAYGSQAGFTMMEVLISSLIGSFLLAGFLSMASFQASTTRDQTQQVDLQQQVRNLAELFAREVRRAGANPTCSNNVKAIDFASFWMLRINSDLDGDGLINALTESVTYQHDPVTDRFRRVANNQIETLLENVSWQDSRLRYFDGNGVELVGASYGLSSAQRAQVRRVQIVIDVTQTSANGEIVRAQASSDINLRNRFFIQAAGC